jgi:hypothetical protein
MKYSSILIITYGRSGSTLLQALLNSIDGCVVRGENDGLCYGLYRAYASLMQSKVEANSVKKELRGVSFPWFGADEFDDERFIQDAWQLIRHQLISEREEGTVQCLGFKEIRYLKCDLYGKPGESVNHLPSYLDFLSKVFPNPAFIFLTRDHEQVMLSGWWKTWNKANAQKLLDEFEAETKVYSEDKSWIFRIAYSDIVERSPRLKAMYEFLGVTYEDNRVEQVLAKKHSFAMGEYTEKSLKNYDFHFTEIPGLVDKISIDDLPFRLVSGAFLDINGILVLNQELSDGYSLLAVDGEGEYPVQWGIASPMMAKTYPENPNASRARFKTTGLRLSKEAPISLFLVDGEGERHKVIAIWMVDNNLTTLLNAHMPVCKK